MVHNVTHVLVQVVQRSAVMEQRVFATMNVKHIIPPRKHVRIKQMVQHVPVGCV